MGACCAPTLKAEKQLLETENEELKEQNEELQEQIAALKEKVLIDEFNKVDTSIDSLFDSVNIDKEDSGTEDEETGEKKSVKEKLTRGEILLFKKVAREIVDRSREHGYDFWDNDNVSVVSMSLTENSLAEHNSGARKNTEIGDTNKISDDKKVFAHATLLTKIINNTIREWRQRAKKKGSGKARLYSNEFASIILRTVYTDVIEILGELTHEVKRQYDADHMNMTTSMDNINFKPDDVKRDPMDQAP